MARNGDRNNNHQDLYLPNTHHRRQSVLASSDAKNDILAVDCILVYSHKDDENEFKNNNKSSLSRSELRKRFEEYLVKKQGLILEHFKSVPDKIGYVKVHTPFEILLLTAENIRMRLPIEKILHDHDRDNDNHVKTCWHRFTKWCKKPFRLDISLEKDDPDYYTAVYSRNIDKFERLFVDLRGSKELYFTSSERSLLTYELLSRAHFEDFEYDHDQQSPAVQKPALNTEMGLATGSKRPGIDRLIAKKAYDSCFPLHASLEDDISQIDDKDLNDREKLRKYWTNWRRCLKFQPLSLIRSYMGEKVAFYFALFGYYNQMLILPSIVGFIIFIYGVASVFSDPPTSDICGSFGQSTYMCPRCDISCPFWKLSDSCVYSKISYVFDNAATVVFAVLMSLWARWCVEFWERRQAVLQYEWDSIDFEGRLEPARPEFETEAEKRGELRLNPVTDIKEKYIPTRKRVPFFLIAAAVVLIAMAIVCATLFGTIVYRIQIDYILKKTSVKTYSSIIITVTCAIMNLLCSLVLSQFYYWIAQKLTDLELHKFQSKYEDSLVIKIYLFQFVNFYSSLFYIAFFKGRFLAYPSTYGDENSGSFTEQCDPAGCLVELSIQVLIIMTGKQMISLLYQFIVAMHRSCMCVCCGPKAKKKEKQWEKDNDLNDFTSNTLMDEYIELVVQFGFVTLFVVAFPLAPLFALLNNIIEIRLDAWKFLSKFKRPIPFKASDIGTLSDIISGVSHLAVLTNAIVIAWTSEFIPKVAYRVLQSTGTDLSGYVNWTLSSFPITDYNLTGTMPSGVPAGLAYCRYREFRSTTAPYSHTSTFWNVLAARLAFIIVFEHLIFFVIYLLEWLIPDVPQKIQDKIDHERYIDQRERWASQTNKDNFEGAIIASRALAGIANMPNGNTRSHSRPTRRSPIGPNTRSPIGPNTRSPAGSTIRSSTEPNTRSPVRSNTRSPFQQPNRNRHFGRKISPEDEY